VKALRRARRLAEKTGVELTDWEGEFLGSVEQRVRTYGRAFGDRDKGAETAALSDRQAVKLKQIVRKAKTAAAAPPQPADDENA
jgi:ABC-type enterochelin transport system substrate-binding protein